MASRARSADGVVTTDAATKLWHLERARILRLKRLEIEGRLISRARVRQAFARIAGIIMNGGETLQRRFGVEARDILAEVIGEAHREVEREFSDSAAELYRETEPTNVNTGDGTETNAGAVGASPGADIAAIC